MSLGRKEGAGVYALLGSSRDQGDDADASVDALHEARTPARPDDRSSSRGGNRGPESAALARQRDTSHLNPALRSEERASELERQSVQRRGEIGDRNSRRMSDVRFEQLGTKGVAAAPRSARFADLAAKHSVELPQFTFNKAHVAAEAQKCIDGLGDFGNYGVKLSIFRSNVRGAENDAKAAASDYTDAVLDVQDAQKQAMRMLNTLGPRIDRWYQASLSIVKLQQALAAAHALDQKALRSFVRAAQGARLRAPWLHTPLGLFSPCVTLMSRRGRNANSGDEGHHLGRQRAATGRGQRAADGAMQVPRAFVQLIRGGVRIHFPAGKTHGIV